MSKTGYRIASGPITVKGGSLAGEYVPVPEESPADDGFSNPPSLDYRAVVILAAAIVILALIGGGEVIFWLIHWIGG